MLDVVKWEQLEFEERQKQWTGFRRRFIQYHGRGERPTVWEIWVLGDRVYTCYGLLGGAIQETSYQGKAKNVGKTNAISREEDALAEARRDCRKKRNFEGFDEHIGVVNIDLRSGLVDVPVDTLLTRLPRSFSLYKPQNNFWDSKHLLQKAREGKVWYTLKRDGMAKLVVVDARNQVHIYSRRSLWHHDKEGPKERADGTVDLGSAIPWTARFPHIVTAVQALKLPPGTMLAGELVFIDPAGRDNFAYVQSLIKSLTPKAQEDMAMYGYPSLYVWDMPFYHGVDLLRSADVRQRFTTFWEHFQSLTPETHAIPYLLPLEAWAFASPESALEKARELGIEGWVVVDPEAIYGDRGWNLKGKPDRPAGSTKLKPKSEDDFVTMWDPDNKIGTWGTGKHEAGKLVTLPDGQQVTHGGVGSVGLLQYNSAGELIYCCDCSSGMDYSFQARLRKEHFPFVAQITYDSRTYISEGEKTNSLRFPVFERMRLRTEKKSQECINPRL